MQFVEKLKDLILGESPQPLNLNITFSPEERRKPDFSPIEHLAREMADRLANNPEEVMIESLKETARMFARAGKPNPGAAPNTPESYKEALRIGYEQGRSWSNEEYAKNVCVRLEANGILIKEGRLSEFDKKLLAKAKKQTPGL